MDCSERAGATGIQGHVKHFLDACVIYTQYAQSYEGAAVMSGHVNRVQQKLYIHSMAHKINLLLVDACKVNFTATMFYHILESLNSRSSRVLKSVPKPNRPESLLNRTQRA